VLEHRGGDVGAEQAHTGILAPGMMDA
jgi:hypothetical protein